MGHKLVTLTYQTTVGDSDAKAVLAYMAHRGCDFCGLVWPGIAHIHNDAEMWDDLVRKRLKKLVHDGFLEVFRYPFGGRGLSTEYVVFPHLWDGVIRPCNKCRANMKNPPESRRVLADTNPPQSRRVSGETLPDPGSKPSPHDATPTVIHQQQPSRAHARGAIGGRPASGRAAASDSAPQAPLVPVYSDAELREIAGGLGFADRLPEPKAP